MLRVFSNCSRSTSSHYLFIYSLRQTPSSFREHVCSFDIFDRFTFSDLTPLGGRFLDPRMASDESGERSRHRRLEGHAQNLLLEHLCSARSHDQIHQAFERLSIDNSRAGPSRSARSNDAPSRAFFTFMASFLIPEYSEEWS